MTYSAACGLIISIKVQEISPKMMESACFVDALSAVCISTSQKRL